MTTSARLGTASAGTAPSLAPGQSRKEMPGFRQVFINPWKASRPLSLCDAELRQQAPDRHRARPDVISVLDEPGYHLARPQRILKIELHRVLRRHRVVDPLELPAVQLWRTAKQRLCFKCPPILHADTDSASGISPPDQMPKTFATTSGLSPFCTRRTARSLIASSVA